MNDEIAEQNREMARIIAKSRTMTFLTRRRALVQAQEDLERIERDAEEAWRVLGSIGLVDNPDVDKDFETQREFAKSLLHDRKRELKFAREGMEEACELLEEAGLDSSETRELLNA